MTHPIDLRRLACAAITDPHADCSVEAERHAGRLLLAVKTVKGSGQDVALIYATESLPEDADDATITETISRMYTSVIAERDGLSAPGVISIEPHKET